MLLITNQIISINNSIRVNKKYYFLYQYSKLKYQLKPSTGKRLRFYKEPDQLELFIAIATDQMIIACIYQALFGYRRRLLKLHQILKLRNHQLFPNSSASKKLIQNECENCRRRYLKSPAVNRRPLKPVLCAGCSGKRALGASLTFIDGAISGKLANGLSPDSSPYRERKYLLIEVKLAVLALKINYRYSIFLLLICATPTHSRLNNSDRKLPIIFFSCQDWLRSWHRCLL